MKTVMMLNIPVCIDSRDRSKQEIDLFLQGASLRRIVTANPEIMVYAHRTPPYAEIVRTADLVLCDGIGIILLARATGQCVPFSCRFTGVALTEYVFERAAELTLRVLIILPRDALSAKDEVARVVEERYPAVEVLIVDEQDSTNEIVEFHPSIAFVALGVPHQEYWIRDNATSFASLRLAVGVGGTFDFFTGRMRRAPAPMRRVGLEWLWRLVQEPKRLRRIITATIVFPYFVLYRRWRTS